MKLTEIYHDDIETFAGYGSGMNRVYCNLFNYNVIRTIQDKLWVIIFENHFTTYLSQNNYYKQKRISR